MNRLDDLVGNLRGVSGDCAFCGRDPYHYVDNGVGMERVAVTCCDEGIALYQHGDSVLARQVELRQTAATAITELRDMLVLILPLAKGYAAANRVGSNADYIQAADDLLAAQAENGQ